VKYIKFEVQREAKSHQKPLQSGFKLLKLQLEAGPEATSEATLKLLL